VTRPWPLEYIVFVILGILLAILLLTFLWRHFFRWDTRYGLKQRGTDMGTHRAFEPPFPKDGGATIVVLDQTGLDPRFRGTWIVQGLLAAGFRVLLARSAGGITKILRESRCVAIVHHDSFARKGGIDAITACIDATEASGTLRTIFVNEGGSPGVMAIVNVIARASKDKKSTPAQYSLISCARSPLLDSELALFHDTLVVRRSKASLRDAELQAVGFMLKWLSLYL
jgi:hypothetical protein